MSVIETRVNSVRLTKPRHGREEPMKLHTYGRLRNWFRSLKEIRTMRTYWRQRNDLVRAAGIFSECRRRSRQ